MRTLSLALLLLLDPAGAADANCLSMALDPNVFDLEKCGTGNTCDLSGATTLAGADLNKKKLKGCDLSGADLTGTQMEEVDLEDAVLTGATLSGANLFKAKMLNVDLNGVTAAGTQFVEAELFNVQLDGMVSLVGANFNKAKMERASLKNVVCTSGTTGCNFDEAELDLAVLDGAMLSYSTFKKAKLQSVSMVGATAQHCDFEEANISGEQSERPRLTGAYFQYSNFRLANMKAADLSGSDFTNATFDDAYLENVTGMNVVFDYISTSAGTTITDFTCTPGCSFIQASLAGLTITDTDIHGADLMNADLTSTFFEDAVLCHVNLQGAILSFARIVDADLSGTEANPTNLNNAVLSPMVFFDDVDLSYTLLHGANLSGAQLSDTKMVGIHAQDAVFSFTMVHYADFTGSNLKRTQWNECGMDGAVFAGAEMEGSNLNWAWGTGTSFCGADLTDSTMVGANFYKSFFGTQCNKETQLVTNIGARVEGVDFTDADVTESDFQETVGFGSTTNPPIIVNVDSTNAIGFNNANPPPPPEFVFSRDAPLNSDDLEWAEALEVCQTLGKTLAYIEDATDNADVQLAAGGRRVWIGLSNQDPQDSSAAPFPAYKWIMGFSLFSDIDVLASSYTNFATTPSSPPSQPCVYMDNNMGGTWTGGSCNLKRPFVCGPIPEPV